MATGTVLDETCLRAMFESLADAVGVSVAGRHLFVNPAYLRLFGLPPGTELAGRSILELIAPRSHAQIADYVARRTRGESVPSRYEVYGRRQDGSEFELEVSASSYQASGQTHTLVLLRDLSERRRAEREIAERSMLLRQIMDTASVAIFLVDLQGRITHANRRMAEMFGCALDEIIGSEYVAHVHPHEREIGRAKMLGLLASEVAAVDLERRYWRKDGTEFWGQLTGRRFYDTHGGKLGLIGVITDIDARRRAEARLKESEEKYKCLVEATDTGYVILDGAGTVVDANTEYVRITGHARLEQILHHSVIEWTAPYDQARNASAVARCIAEGFVHNLEIDYVAIDGSSRPIEINASVSGQGDNLRIYTLCRDISDRRRAERALADNEARYRSLFEAANDGIFIADEPGLVDCNRRATEMLGLPKAQIIGRPLTAFAPERQPTGRQSVEVAAEMMAAARRGVPQTFEWQLAGAGDVPVDVDVTLSQFVLDGRPHLQAIVRDIGERKHLERERQKAQKLESLGTLAGGIAHDFNNLLQGVFGYISMARLSLDDRGPALANLEQAEQALHQAVHLTSQLLTFAKGGRPTKAVIDLRPVVKDSVRLALSGSRVETELTMSDDLRCVDADAGQIGQVIQNIVLNAEQAMPLGGKVEISVVNAATLPGATTTDPDGAGSVVITVSDHGLGIPPEHLPRIFDPYFTTKEKGSGLGLATAYSIVKNHGGTISCRSRLGQGSTFTVCLPASTEVVVPCVKVPSRERLRRGRVLVMDDDAIVLKVAVSMLEALGCEVVAAADGTAAVQHYRQALAAAQPFDAVILDLTIRGGMGGQEAAQALRQLDPQVKAVVSSGYSDDAVVASYRQHGFCAFLKKPYTLAALREVLDAVVGS